MTPNIPQSSRAGRFGELALWTAAGLVVLTGHIAAAAVLLRQEAAPPADPGPPAAIMIELAAEPEAVNTEEDQIAGDMTESQEIVSKQMEPVAEPPPEPTIDPVEPPPPEEIVEPAEPEPEPEPVEQPEPEPEITETIPEPLPEPVEEIDPVERQMIAALENVEVPLPVSRPPPPPEPKKEPPKRVRKQPQASMATQEAKLQAKQSERTAASRTSAGTSRPSVSPAKWKSRVQSKIARNVRRCPGNDRGVAAVRFSFDSNGNITNVSLSRSSGNSAIDDYIVSAVRRASPIPAPPAGVASYLDQGLKCQ